MNTAFESWHAQETAKGLVDIKFAVVQGKGVSVEAIQTELLASEAAVAQGLVKPAPLATSMVPEQITEYVRAS